MSFTDKLKKGLQKTKAVLFMEIDASLFTRGIGEDLFLEIEEKLIAADVGVKASMEIVERLREAHKSGKLKKPADLKPTLKSIVLDILGLPQPFVIFGERPFVVLCIGVNGVGKTTTIGKLAHKAITEGHGVVMAAADTFRAAAIEQLDIWSKRTGAQIVKHQPGSDPAAVAFDALEAAKSRGLDLCIIDTAGRLHTKTPLMEELKKIKRVLAKSVNFAPHETLLVVDATNGQNALHQARMFNEAIGVTGLVLTKLDGTAKGGIVLAIRRELNIPIRMIGVGESIDDCRDFVPEEFASALFD
ncbi:MAG: signal recognition particle-docking protein FtsY [Nitrospirae bacterium]|nr:signal recognition particle-docking protein FtsY [Nitrospirota bacterium]